LFNALWTAFTLNCYSFFVVLAYWLDTVWLVTMDLSADASAGAAVIFWVGEVRVCWDQHVLIRNAWAVTLWYT
jgi:hypothetical protein